MKENTIFVETIWGCYNLNAVIIEKRNKEIEILAAALNQQVKILKEKFVTNHL